MARLMILFVLSFVLVVCDDDSPPFDGGPDGSIDGSGDDSSVEPCDDDDACDDGLFCNGPERCVEGACSPGEAPDCGGPVGCEMGSCSEEENRCETVPRDDDGDGQPSERCGGDDCDDTVAAVFRGALERCNGVDDDCDSRADESVATRVLETRHSAPPDAVSEGDEIFIVWAEQTLPPTPGPRTSLIGLTEGGAPAGSPIDLGLSAGAPAIDTGEDGLGVLWISGCESPVCHPRLHFSRFGWDLVMVGEDLLLDEEESTPSDPDSLWTGEGWIAVWIANDGEERGLHVRPLAVDGSAMGETMTLSSTEHAPSHPTTLWAGTTVVVAWTELRDGAREVVLARLTPDGALLGSPSAPIASAGATPGNPSLDWTGDEIGLVFDSDADHPGRFDLVFARLDAEVAPIETSRVITGALSEGSSSGAQILWAGDHHVVLWHHQIGNIESIYFARVESSGVLRDDPIWIDRAEGTASRPRALWPPGGLVVSWGGDYLDRFDGRGLYLSRVCLP